MSSEPLVSTLYHLTPEISGPKVEILGIWHVGHYTPIPRLHRQYLTSVLSKQNGFILTEGLESKPSTSFVPRRFLSRAKAVEHGTVRSFGYRYESRVGYLFNPGSLEDFLRRFPKRLADVPMQVSRTPISKTEERKEKGWHDESWRFLLNARSVLMASEILAYRQKIMHLGPGTPISFVCGALHASQIHRFLEDPRLALIYIRRLKRQLAPAFRTVYLQSHFGPNAQKVSGPLKERLLRELEDKLGSEIDSEKQEFMKHFDLAEARFEQFAQEQAHSERS